MKYLDEYRDAKAVRNVLAEIERTITRLWTLMEVCGGQTHSIIRHGLDQLLPDEIELVHGPGCPVCVTPLELIDKAIALAARPDVIFTMSQALTGAARRMEVPSCSSMLRRARRRSSPFSILLSKDNWGTRRWGLSARRLVRTGRSFT